MQKIIAQWIPDAATRVTLVGSVLDLLLGVLKIMVGLASNSLGLVSDGIHSLSDLVTDAFVLVINRLSRAAPDHQHPYGHRRFETVGTIILGIILFGIASIICYDAARRLVQDTNPPVPGWTGLVVALASIAGKEWIFRYTRRVADEVGSSLLLANAWHSRTDAFSSIAVLLGILGAMAGFPALDAVAAIVVALVIAWIAWRLAWSSLSELVDTAMPPAQVDAIRRYALDLEGIRGVHDLRTRLHGGQGFIDIHVEVDGRISVSEGHYLADRLAYSLKSVFTAISDVVVHVDPEPDLETGALAGLPQRPDIEALIKSRWVEFGLADEIGHVDLHYLQHKVDIEIYINKYINNKEILDKVKVKLEGESWVGKLTFYAPP